MLRSKADTCDLLAIKEAKTNKQDTVQCMRAIDTLHKMLESVACLQVQAMKWQAEGKKLAPSEMDYKFGFLGK